MAFSLIAISVFVLDQIIKFIISKAMIVNQSIPVVNNIFNITYVQNKGAAFGIFWGIGWPLILIGILVILGIVYFHEKMKINDFTQLPLALLLGGSMGNIFDRVFRSYVIDYLDFRVWPVFNLADIMINVGVLLIIIHLFQEESNY